MADSITVDVEGMRAFRRDIGAVDKEIVKELGRAYKGIGTMIAEDAATKANALGGVAAKAANAVKATARTTDVAVKLNAGARTPFAFGAEFGGGSRPATRQFRPWKGSGKDAGYFLYPTIRDDGAKILHAYEEAVDAATARAFPHRT